MSLHRGTWAFCSCRERGLLFVGVYRLLIVGTSLVAEHRLQARVFPEGPVTSELVPRVHGGTQVSRKKTGWGNWRGWHSTGSHAGSGEKAAGGTSTGSRGKAPRGKSGGPGARRVRLPP